MAGSVSDLESYLSELQEEGRLQSQGRFTLDFDKALQKLGALAQQQVHRWVFFAVQAAVGFRASQVKLSVSHRAVSVTFELPSPSPALLDGRAFQSVEEKPDLRGDEAAEQNLRQALLWGRALNPKSFAMMVEGQHPGYLLQATLQGMEYHKTPLKGGPTNCALILAPSAQNLESGSAFAAALQAEAVYRLSFCPVPAYLEGLHLSLGDSNSLIRNRRRRKGNVKLLERYVLDPDPQAPSLAVIHPKLQPAQTYAIEGRNSIRRKRDWLPAPRVFQMEVSAPDIQRVEWEVLDGPGPFEGVTLGEWTVPEGPEQHLQLKLDSALTLDAFDGERIRARALLTRMRVEGNFLVLARHGMLLNPVPVEVMPEHGWVGVVATNLVHVDASGLVAVEDDRLERLKKWFRAEVYAIHERLGSS